MPDSGPEGIAARVGDAVRFVKQAQRMLESAEELNRLVGADVPTFQLALARLAHLETCAEHLRQHLHGLVEAERAGHGPHIGPHFDAQAFVDKPDTRAEADFRQGAVAVLACREIQSIMGRASRQAGEGGTGPVFSPNELAQIDAAAERGAGQ